MINNKILEKVIVVLLVISLMFVATIAIIASDEEYVANAKYVDQIFTGDIIDFQIIANETDWANLLENPLSEEYIPADVIINGKKISKVGIRTKGNSSLTQVASSDSDRYSFRIKFDEYITGQTYYGLETIVINNMVSDNSYMIEYMSYDMFTFLGVDTPLMEYADISINGESWGLYLAIETYSESYLKRIYNDIKGELYNVKMVTGAMGGGAREQGESTTSTTGELPSDDATNTINPTDENSETEPSEMSGKGNMGASDTGGSLVYTDDNIDSYASIFENGVGNVTDENKKKVITALKNLSDGTDLEKYIDVDQTLRYFAAHTFSVNLDSYVSSMAQNFYLYERDGQLTILPWDYNLSFGLFQSKDASSVVNFPIDTPVSGIDMEDRPLLNVLLENEQYKAKYHEYLQMLVEEYYDNNGFETRVNELYLKIKDYVKNDKTAFITYEQFETSVEMLKEMGNLRSESVKLQLLGDIPSTTDGQNADSSNLVDADTINMSELGSSRMGGEKGTQDGEQGRNGMGGPFANMDNNADGKSIDMKQMQEIMTSIRENNNVITDEQKAQLTALGFTEEDVANFTMGQSPDRQANGGTQTSDNIARNKITVGLSSFSLLIALGFAKLFKRKL